MSTHDMIFLDTIILVILLVVALVGAPFWRR